MEYGHTAKLLLKRATYTVAVGAIIVLFGFFVTIVDFQSSVQKRISDSGVEGITYLQIVVRARESERLLNANEGLRTRIEVLRNDLTKLQEEMVAAVGNLSLSRDRLDARVALWVKRTGCEPQGELTAFDPSSCTAPPSPASDAAQPPAPADGAPAAQSLNDQIVQLQEAVVAASARASSIDLQITNKKQEIETIAIPAQATAGISDPNVNAIIMGIMSELDMLDNNGWLGFLLQLPPLLSVVALVAVAGAVGSLMMILFIKVYPNLNEEEFTTNRGIGGPNRVVLGSLVAVAIFFAMGSTTLVLDPGGTLEGGLGTNAISLSFIGILGGAFSAKVAQWLASRVSVVLPGNNTGGTGDTDNKGTGKK